MKDINVIASRKLNIKNRLIKIIKFTILYDYKYNQAYMTTNIIRHICCSSNMRESIHDDFGINYVY